MCRTATLCFSSAAIIWKFENILQQHHTYNHIKLSKSSKPSQLIAANYIEITKGTEGHDKLSDRHNLSKNYNK